MVDDTGHSPEVDEGFQGLEGTTQEQAGLAFQGPEGRLDAEDALLAVNGELEVGSALRLVLYPEGLLRAHPEVDPTEVHAGVLQEDSRTWTRETGVAEEEVWGGYFSKGTPRIPR